MAFNDALRATFNKPNALATAIAKGKGTSTVAQVGGDIAAPFVRTPANVGQAYLDYSPVGLAKTAVDVMRKMANDPNVTDRAIAETFGRGATGTALLFGAYELAKRGIITGSSPTSEAERSQQELEGKKPGSIYVDGQWRQISRVSPIGNLFVLAADLFKAGKKPEDVNAMTLIGFMGKGFTDSSFLQGPATLLRAITDPGAYAESFTERLAGGVVPTAVARLAQATDLNKEGRQVVREPEGITGAVMNRLPGLRQELPEKLNALGETSTYQNNGVIGALLDPTNPSRPTDDPLIQELSRVEYNLNRVGKTLALDDEKGADKLTPELRREYQRRAGLYIKDFLPKVISSSAYQSATTEQQNYLVESAVNKAKAKARDEIKTAYKAGELSNKQSSDLIPTTSAAGPAGASSIPSYPLGELNRVYEYVDNDGKIQTIDLTSPVTLPIPTGYEDLDKELTSTYKSNLSNRVNDIRKIYETGQITAEQAQQLIGEVVKQSNSTKKPKKLRVSMRSIPKLKLNKPRKIKTKRVKLAQIRLDPQGAKNASKVKLQI
jgi:hypothetical protein